MGIISSRSLCIIVYAFGIHSFISQLFPSLATESHSLHLEFKIYSVFPSKFRFCPVLPPFACLHLIIYILKLSMM